MGVRDYPKNREEDNGQEAGVDINWLGRCLEDRFEIGAVVAQTDLVAIHEANTVDDGAPLLATIYKGLELDDAGLEVLHHHLGALREGGYEPACGMVQAPEGFVVFERAPNGCALSSYLKKQESVTTATALVIGGQILASLDALHDIGQVSHSLAPHSIWIDDSGERLVCAVTRLGQQSLLGLINAKTRSDGACYAFPSYLMPEAVSGRELTPASDIYCAGLVLYELLAGRAAFAGDDFKKVARKHALERPLNPRIVNRQAKLSSELDRAIMKALEKTVKRRHESAMAFFEVLKSTAEGADVWSAGSATVVVEATVEPAGEVMETLMMGSLASEGGTNESLGSIAVATTADAFPESSDASNAESSHGQTQPFSSTLTRSVLAGMAENKREKEKAAGGVETQAERSPSRSSKPRPSSNEPQNGEVAFAENADWYADSPEQYESKTAHYDPYELEGEDRDRNLLPKILLGVVASTVVIFLAVSGLSGSESDTQQPTKKDAAKTEQLTQSKTATLVAAKTDKAPADKTAADKTAADKTAADKTAADKTAADKAAADKTAADKTVVDKSAKAKAAVDKTAADKTAADKTAAAKAAADKTAADKAAADKAAADKAAADKAAADKAAADKAAADKAAADKTAAAKAAADKAAADKTAAAKAAADKAAADKAAKAKAAATAKAKAKAVSTKSMTAKPLAAKAKKPVASKASLTSKQATAVVEAKERAKREAAERKIAEKRQREAKAATALSEGSKLLKQGEYVSAKTKFMTALKTSGLGSRGIATARAGLGAIEYESANFSGSVKQYKISVGKYNRNADRWYLLARSYYRLGNKVDARKSLDKALALKSNHAKAKKLLKRVQP